MIDSYGPIIAWILFAVSILGLIYLAADAYVSAVMRLQQSFDELGGDDTDTNGDVRLANIINAGQPKGE